MRENVKNWKNNNKRNKKNYKNRGLKSKNEQKKKSKGRNKRKRIDSIMKRWLKCKRNLQVNKKNNKI